MAAMTTATLAPAASYDVDPLDFSLADRLATRSVGKGRLLIGQAATSGMPAKPHSAAASVPTTRRADAAASQSRTRPGLLFVPGGYHGAWCYAHYLDYFARAGLPLSLIHI